VPTLSVASVGITTNGAAAVEQEQEETAESAEAATSSSSKNAKRATFETADGGDGNAGEPFRNEEASELGAIFSPPPRGDIVIPPHFEELKGNIN